MRLQKIFTDELITEQHHREQCDVNQIMARFKRSGAIDHVSKHGPTYQDNTSLDYHTGMNIVAQANTMFAELPASVRKRFHNDPAQFLDFVQNPKNKTEMAELGLLTPEAKALQLAEKPVEKTKKPAETEKKASPNDEPAS